jgi:nucleoside-diphosphate-sugar epimerase
LGEVYCSPEKAEKILWWKAKISIEESVKNGLRFYENTLKKD